MLLAHTFFYFLSSYFFYLFLSYYLYASIFHNRSNGELLLFSSNLTSIFSFLLGWLNLLFLTPYPDGQWPGTHSTAGHSTLLDTHCCSPPSGHLPHAQTPIVHFWTPSLMNTWLDTSLDIPLLDTPCGK